VKIKEPFLLIFSILWILFFLAPIPIRSKTTKAPATLWQRILFLAIGAASLLLWYSLQ
jgi:hypothetical protein